MPKVRNVSETPTARERVVSLRDNNLVVVTDGKRRVLLTRAVLKRSYDEALEIISTYFPAIPKNRAVIQTDRLEGLEGEFVDITKESWAEVLPLLLSLKITLGENNAVHIAAPVPDSTSTPVRGVTPPPLSSPVREAEKFSGKIASDVFPYDISFTAHYSTKIEKMIQAIAPKFGICPTVLKFIYGDYRIDRNSTFGDIGFQDGDTIFCFPERTGGKPVIYLFSLIEQEVSVQLSLVNEWRFSAVYPVVPIKPSALLGGETLTWRAITHNDQTLTETTTGLRASYLYWEAVTDRCERPPSPLPETSEPSLARSFSPIWCDLNDDNSIVLPVSTITPYLDKALASLGLHVEARTSFITYWLPTILKHTYIALRFVPQNEYETAAVLHIEPSPDVVTRIFMLFKGISEDRLGEWSGAISRSQDKVEWWRDVVGLVSKERQSDEKLFRVLEWGGMEVRRL
ncbi:hypothetical protein EDD85DRAFT_1005714 [Armillaria nabsnona]|nr:hypothetical protein EDD85DRAFT_1005714 [Armillaria nabsnona]